MACLVLTGIHVYLGVHVIARKVIFVDLALAQIAALGTVTGVLLGYEVGNDTNALYLYSLAFTFLGAFIFSKTKMLGEKVPNEAILGIVYAVAFAATILVLAKSPLGPQELDRIIKGELLWVQGPLVIKTAIIYSIIGTFHFVFRDKFIPISFDPEKAEASGINVRLWDFLFYMSFGFVITSSVAIAGVFLVFSYLVIPAVAAILFSDKLSTRLAIGWVGGAIISFIGVKLSWHTGLPTSPLIVVLLALSLVVGAIVRYVRVSPDKKRAAMNIAVSTAVFAFFIGGVFFFHKAEEDPFEHTLHMLSSPLSTDRQSAILNLASFAGQKNQWMPLVIEKLHDEDAEVRKGAVELAAKTGEHSALPQILKLLNDKSDDVRRSAIQAVKTLGDGDAAVKLIKSAQVEEDVEIKIQLLETALSLGNPDAIPALLQIIESGGIFADDAYDHLQRHIGLKFKPGEAQKVKRWWEERRGKLLWDEGAKMFVVK